jgi:tetratricopeptide (TPR) repeat protein
LSEGSGLGEGGMQVTVGFDGQASVDMLLGANLPEAAEKHLAAAAQLYAEDALALEQLRAAEAIAPAHPAVLIGLYRFYFYKNRLRECLDIALTCLSEAAQLNNLSNDWREVRSTDAEFGSYDAMMPRFFLFVLKGYAYLQMRLGNLDEGLAATMKLLELDPSDKIGATVLLEVHQRLGQTDEE